MSSTDELDKLVNKPASGSSIVPTIFVNFYHNSQNQSFAPGLSLEEKLGMAFKKQAPARRGFCLILCEPRN